MRDSNYRKRENYGSLYGVGVGIGDPESLTLKAVRIIKESDMIAVPTKEKDDSRAYRIAGSAIPEVKSKKILTLDFEMTRDPDKREANHKRIYERIKKHILEGKNIAFLTIGDPALYSTFTYISNLAAEDGIKCETISGISSAFSCAARLGIPLGEGDERIHIIPDIDNLAEELTYPGTKVIMKCAKSMSEIKQILRDYEERCKRNKKKLSVYAVSDCDRVGETCYKGVSSLPDQGEYMLTIIVKEKFQR